MWCKLLFHSIGDIQEKRIHYHSASFLPASAFAALVTHHTTPKILWGSPTPEPNVNHFPDFPAESFLPSFLCLIIIFSLLGLSEFILLFGASSSYVAEDGFF